MIISMINFRDILISRPAGRDAFLVGKSYIFSNPPLNESIILDFKKIKVLASSWGDEFINGLRSLYSNTIEAINVDSLAVKAAPLVVLV